MTWRVIFSSFKQSDDRLCDKNHVSRHTWNVNCAKQGKEECSHPHIW